MSYLKNNLKKHFNIIIYVVILVGIILRIIYIEKQSLWLDEVTTIQISKYSISDITSGKLFDNHTPPLYYMIMHFWGKIVPLTEFGIRILSVIFDILNMIVFLLLCITLISKENTILVLGAYALSPFMIYYSQEGRMYTLLVLFVLLFSYFMVKLLHCKIDNYKWVILSGIAFSCGIYTHYYMIFIAMGLYILFIYINRNSWKQIKLFLTSGLIGITLFIPWLPIVTNLATSGGQQFRKFTIMIIPYTLFRFVYGYAVFPINMYTKENIQNEIVKHSLEIIAVIIACILIINALKRSLNNNNKEIIMALGWIICFPVLVCTLISLKSPMISERYLIIILPFLYLMFFGFIDITKRMNIVAVMVLFTLMSQGVLYYYYNNQFGKAQWREAGQFISKYAKKEDVIIVEPGYAIPIFKYYFRGENNVFTASDMLNKDNLLENNYMKSLRKKSRVINITSGSIKNTNYSLYIEKNFDKIYSINYPLETGITCNVWKYKINEPLSINNIIYKET